MSKVDLENRWRELAAQILIETDRTKLLHLIKQLCEVFDVASGDEPRQPKQVASAD
jgi:hypothetical protein